MEDLELLEVWRSGDVVQKTFMACVEGRDRVNTSSFRAYLFGVARNILYGEYRRRRKDEAVDFGTSSVQDLDPGLSTALGKKEEHRLLLQALRRIPLNYQVALELYYVEGMRGPELAEVLDVPEPTVRSRIRRGLEQVKKEIERLASTPALAESTVGGLESWAAGLGAQMRGIPS